MYRPLLPQSGKNTDQNRHAVLRPEDDMETSDTGVLSSVLSEQGEKPYKGEMMAEDKKYTPQEFHQGMAAGLFNKTLDLLEKQDRSEDENDLMEYMAHASMYHWTRVEGYTPLNKARGEWMLAHVSTILKQTESALRHARKCLDITLENDYQDFDLGYAYEGLARACALAGDRDGFMENFEKAKNVAIKKVGDQKQYSADLENEPWFGMK